MTPPTTRIRPHLYFTDFPHGYTAFETKGVLSLENFNNLHESV
jgi:hypothetical protein